MFGKGLRLFCILAMAGGQFFLAGCFSFNGGYDQVQGERYGVGTCDEPGTARLALVRAVPEGAFWNITIRLTNLESGHALNGFSWLGVRSAAGYISAPGLQANRTSDVEPGASIVLSYDLEGVPSTGWQEFGITFHHVRDERWREPTHLTCSLEGDNAPEAFA